MQRHGRARERESEGMAYDGVGGGCVSGGE